MRAWFQRHRSRGLALLLLGGAFGGAGPAHAFVSTPVGGRPGELDIHAQFTAERGKIEPNENERSWMDATDFYEYELGVGYTWGHFGILQFFSTRLEFTYFQSPEEKSDPARWPISPEGTSTEESIVSECSAGARYLGSSACRFYAADTGGILTASVSTALIHDPKFALGVYLRGSVPVDMDLDKFANPRIDYLAGGTQLGVELASWLSYESVLFLGLGTRPFGSQQNGALALSNLLHFKASRWLLPWRAGIKVGPYVEGDIHQRFDERYDNAYSPLELPREEDAAPVRARDRIRAARFALALLPYFLVTDQLAVELGYVQKFYGYDARATQALFAGVRGLFDFGR